MFVVVVVFMVVVRGILVYLVLGVVVDYVALLPI